MIIATLILFFQESYTYTNPPIWLGEGWEVIGNGGKTFNKKYGHPHDIGFIDSLTGFLFCRYGAKTPLVFRTTDGGKYWEEIFIVPNYERENGVITRRNTALGQIYVSDRYMVMSTRFLLHVEPSDTSIIYRSTDMGKSWEIIETGADRGFFAFSMLNPEHGVMCEISEIAITYDSCKSWVLSPKFPDFVRSGDLIQAIDKDVFLLSSSSPPQHSTANLTTDGGKS